MTLEGLFKKRYSLYMKNLLKYARHIINDHFVLVFFLLIGVGGYTYSQFLETIAYGMVGPRILVLFLFFILTSAGSITLLLEPADSIFLLPKEREFRGVFKRLTARSFASQMISTALLTFVTFPIFVTTLNVSTTDSIFIFLTLASLKWLNLLTKIYPFFYTHQKQEFKLEFSMQLIKILTLVSLLFIQIRTTAIIITAIALFSAYQFFTEKIYFNQFFKWEIMIEKEERRMQRIYRFIQMFVDVPHMKTRIRRLAWLDKPLNWLSQHYPTAPYYYILRTVTRNSEYSLLILRVTIVGMLLLAVTESFGTVLLLGILFLYIIGFQLIPLVNEINRTPQFQIYPVSEKMKVEAVYRIIFQILSFVSIFLALASLYTQGLRGFILVLIGIVFSYFFSHFYAPRRLKRVKY